MTQFPIVQLAADVPREREEQLGSKQKFWFRHSDGDLWLFKYARRNTGEHWAERLAAEIAEVLGLPHALVELAQCDGAWGAMTRDFTDEGLRGLVHGNELLTELDPAYPALNSYRVRAHTLDAVYAALGQDFIGRPSLLGMPVAFGAFDVFVGYLLLDAVIGNTDRHHENWGVLLVSSRPRTAELAPTYDHASSLGRELTEEVRHRKYRRSARSNGVMSYLARARSALFATPEAGRPMSPEAAFRAASEKAPPAGQFWLEQLRIHHREVLATVDAVPPQVITDGARAFCSELLGAGIRTLLD